MDPSQEAADEAYGLLLMILLAVLMQLRALEQDRSGADCPSAQQLRTGASLLSVLALMGFDRQAQSQGDPAGRTLSLISLTVGLIRLIRQQSSVPSAAADL